MKFMVEFRLKPGSKNKAAEAFERRGPNRNPDVTFRQAWVATSSDVVFVLVEGSDEAHVAAAAQSWSEHGQSQLHRVIDVEQF
jgi:Domain of unknown function (DUF3303)